MIRIAFLLGCLSVWTSFAQQREPAFEVYALTGGYYHGNIATDNAWKPQFGAGALIPWGRTWAALIDVTTSAVDAANLPPQIGYLRERRIVLMPSIVRLWRRDRFSVYAGAGLGFEHERQHGGFLSVVPLESPRAFQEQRTTRTDAALVLRAGALVSLTRHITLRGGFTLLPRYIDERPSTSLEAGIGYRF